MGRLPGEERACEWSFTELLSLHDVGLGERHVRGEDGETYIVPYAHSIQGRDTARITYKELRKVCSYLGVRYYKNRSKDTMTELIAQKKLNGEVPESYRYVKIAEKKKKKISSVDPDTGADQLFSTKRQRTTPDDEPEVAETTPTIASDTCTNMFLQPVSPIVSENRSLSVDSDSSQSMTHPNQVEMSLTDRTDTFTLLSHVRKQIQCVEAEIATHTQSEAARSSTTKTQRLTHDLEFYLSERQALMQQLKHSRYH